jgi:hypothetical protein
VNGTLTAIFDTFSSNTAETGGSSALDGTDVYVLSDATDNGVNGTSATATLTDDILGQSTHATSDFVSNYLTAATAPTLTASYDLVSNNTPSTTTYANSTGLTGTNLITANHPNPSLAALANNGGPTKTMAYLNGSPVIDAGITADYPGTSNPITTDQRGFTRPVTPSIGAFDGVIIQPTELPIATVNNAYSQQFSVEGGSGFTFSATGLPPGLTISTSGLLSGTPTSASGSPFSLVVSASDGGDTGTKTYTLVVDPALVISPLLLPTPIVDNSYSQQLTPSGGSGMDYTFTSTALPPGLTLSPSGLISGTPTMVTGYTFQVTVTLTDSNDATTTQIYVVTVKQASQAGDLTSSSPQTFYGQSVVLTANFSATAVGSNPMTGTVDFYDGTTYLGTAPLSGTAPALASIAPATALPTATGQAILPTTSLTVGYHDIRAVYSGDTYYSAATTYTPVTVQTQPATTSVTLSSTTTTQGTTLYASVVVTSPGNPPIVGSVSFYDGATLLGTEPVIDDVASLFLGIIAPGSHTYTAVFSGDGTSSNSNITTTISTDGPQIVGLSREGFNLRPTVIVLTFNQPLDTTSAQNPANYELYSSTGHRYAIASVLYNPSSFTVNIVPWQRLPVKGTYKLEVIGTGPNGITNANGLALDGSQRNQPGTNFVTKFNWRALAAPSSPPAVTYLNGIAEMYQGAFAPYFNAAYAATQYYLQHIVPRNRPLPVVPTQSSATEVVPHRPKVVLGVATDAARSKLVIKAPSLISRKPHNP